MTINQRISQIVDTYANGNQKAFSEMLGWKQQFTSRMINTDVQAGMKSVLTILKAFPELNAKWLLLGEGDMFDAEKVLEVKSDVKRMIKDWQFKERFLDVMSEGELIRFREAAKAGERYKVTREQIRTWVAKIGEGSTV